jgi:arylamine N-acetyltransferase
MQFPELEFLKILGLQPEKPTLDFLSRLLQLHQRYIPYENLSKLLRGAKKDFTLPSFDEYLSEIQKFGHGGTCFVQNVHCHRVLQFLGFDSILQGNWIDGKLTHPNLIVRLEEKSFYVDLGIMSSFVGPFVLDPAQVTTKQIGDQTYRFVPRKEEPSALLEIFRNGKMIREIKCSGPTPTVAQIGEGLFKTFGATELFMNNLVVHKSFGDFSLGIWNRSFYRDQDTTHDVTEIKNYQELKDAFKKLEMPKTQLEEALEILESNGVHLF